MYIFIYTYTIYCYSIRRRSWVMWNFGMQTSSSWARKCREFLARSPRRGPFALAKSMGWKAPFQGRACWFQRVPCEDWKGAISNSIHESLNPSKITTEHFLEVIQMWLVFEVIVVPRTPLDRRDKRWAWQLPWVFFWCFSMWWSSCTHWFQFMGHIFPTIFPLLQDVERIHPCFTSPLVASDRVGP